MANRPTEQAQGLNRRRVGDAVFTVLVLRSVLHVAFNPKIASRPFADVLDELAEHVLPQFGS